jgi:hypothetical protein
MDKVNQLLNHWRQSAHQYYRRVSQWLRPHKEQTVENKTSTFMYTDDQLMARLKFFIGICLALTLTGIVFVVLFSLIFVTQPLNAISPIDQKFFELIIPIATFLTGTLSGIMLAGGDKDAQKQALTAANKGWDKPPTPTAPTGGSNNASFGGNTSFGGPTAFGAPSAGGFGNSGGFGLPATNNLGAVGQFSPGADFGQPTGVTTGWGGKPAPIQPEQPLQ